MHAPSENNSNTLKPRVLADPIHVFAMGGTIDKIYFDALSEYQVGAPQVIEILKDSGITQIPKMTRICQKDSLELNQEDRQNLAQKISEASEEKILITHGTDTMSETAQFLLDFEKQTSTTFPNKTIVFVGAMKPARFKETDAPFNVGFALGALQALPPGIWIAMSGALFPAGSVQKNRSAQCFEAKPTIG